MTDRRLYTLTLPEGIQVRTEARTPKSQERQGVLGSDTGNVEAVATEPGERPLTVEYPDKYARIRAAEVRELAKGYSQPLVFHGKTESTPSDGYYSIGTIDRGGPIDPRSGKFQRARVAITKDGTPASHWRRVSTAPATVSHPFGTVTEAPVGIDADASKARWYNPETQATAEPTVLRTASGESADIDIYDANAAPYDRPELIYELPMGSGGVADPRIYDERGNASTRDANGALHWQKVFATSHQFKGVINIDNEVLIVRIDELGSPSISAERWDTGTSSYAAVTLGTSDWEVFDWDIRAIGTAQVGGVAEFRDTTQSPTAYHVLRWQLQRGAANILWTSDTTVPAGLQTLLTPIAADEEIDALGSHTATPSGLRPREEVS